MNNEQNEVRDNGARTGFIVGFIAGCIACYFLM